MVRFIDQQILFCRYYARDDIFDVKVLNQPDMRKNNLQVIFVKVHIQIDKKARTHNMNCVKNQINFYDLAEEYILFEISLMVVSNVGGYKLYPINKCSECYSVNSNTVTENYFFLPCRYLPHSTRPFDVEISALSW